MGDLNKSLTYYERATELAPKDPNQWRLLAIFSIKYELQVREIALPAARQAVLLNPKDPASLDVMAQVFTILDDPLSAQRFLVRSLQADPSYAPARLHLGFLHLMKGHNSDAYQQLSLAASLAPAGTPTEEQAKRLLQRFFP
jgi:tetratricopeptide (TPR) repeat protein